MSAVQDPRVLGSITIASATSITSAFDQEGYRIANLRVSSGWVGTAPMTFSVSQDNASYMDLYNSTGGEVSITSGAFTSLSARAFAIDSVLALQLMGHRWIKFRSGPSTAPVNTTAIITISPVLVPM